MRAGYARDYCSVFAKLLCVGVLVCVHVSAIDRAHAQDDGSETSEVDFEDSFREAFFATRYEEAERIGLRWVRVDPANFVPWYNLACALSMQSKDEEGVKILEQAIVRGFADKPYMESDPHLAGVRTTETYAKIVRNWDTLMTTGLDLRLDTLKQRFGDSYTFERDEEERLAYVCAFGGETFVQIKDDISRLVHWWDSQVLPDDPALISPAGHRAPWDVIILPSREHFAAWAFARYGENWSRIGGAYSNDEKQLVTMDLGATLRHEFWHVLHWRHMNAMGQRHPVWLMEGLCSLVEDIDVRDDGSFEAIPSWRTNQAKGLARSGKLLDLEVLMSMDRKDFVTTRPLSYYAQSRTFFLYLQSQDKLREWYATYVRMYDEDQSGVEATKVVLGTDLRQVNRDYRRWVARLDDAPETIRAGDATVPFELGQTVGDGLPIITSVRSREMREADLRRGDVILMLDRQPVRDRYELVRALRGAEPGDVVPVSFRRGDSQQETELRLVEQE